MTCKSQLTHMARFRKVDVSTDFDSASNNFSPESAWNLQNLTFASFQFSMCASQWPPAPQYVMYFQLPVKCIPWRCNKISSPIKRNLLSLLCQNQPVTQPQLSECTLGIDGMLIWENPWNFWTTSKQASDPIERANLFESASFLNWNFVSIFPSTCPSA